MTERTPVRRLVLTVLLLALSIAGAQIARAQALTDNLPTDPQVTIGKFSNGLT